jgi:replicative DNA helicase
VEEVRVSITDDARPEVRPQSQPGPSGGGGFDKSPPQDIAAEQGVLGGMLLSKDAVADVVEILKSHDFYRPVHATVFDTILDLYGRGEPADALTVAAALADSGDLQRVGGVPYLHTLIESVPTAANAAYYARIVSERAVLRRLVEAGTKIVQLGYGTGGNGGRDVDDIVDLAQQAVYDVTERRVSEDFAVLADMLQPTLDEIEAVGATSGMMTGVPTGFSDLDRLLNGLHPGQLIIVAGRPGLGKALALETPLATPDGWTTMADVAVGDQLIGADGKPTTVVATSEVMLGRPCFEVEFSDGSLLVADALHQWCTRDRKARRRGAPAQIRTTIEIAATLHTATADRRVNHSVSNPAPMQLSERLLPIAPYTFGAWLGDGHSAAPRITSVDPEVILHIEADGYQANSSGPFVYSLHLPAADVLPTRKCVVCGSPFQPRHAGSKCCGRSCGGRARFVSPPSETPRCVDCGEPSAAMRKGNAGRRCRSCRKHTGSIYGLLRTLGVLNNKHIPTSYLRASEGQRRALLAGLLDTDGTVTTTGNCQYASTSRRLAEDVRELILSLGYRCSVTTKPVKGRTPASSVCYTINFTTSDEVFRLHRKAVLHKERSRSTAASRRSARYVVDVRPVKSVPVKCVSIDNADKLYLAGRSMVPTHNSTASMDFARNAAIRANCASAIFSLEMSKIEIVMRLLSAEARVPLHVLRSGQLSDDDWTKLARRMGEISEAPIFVDDTPSMNLMEIRAKARRLKQRHDLKLIVVDYLQLMTSPKRTESRQQEVADLSRGLKLLAKEVECPVIAVSQLNRGPEQRTDKRPQLSDLRESGCLSADTRVLRADTGAETTMGELFNTGARDVPVWALDERLKYVRRHLTHVFTTGDKPVFRLRLASGRQIRATANHPFLTYDGWTPLGELNVGDRVAAPRHVCAPEQVTSWSDRQVVLLAHLLGDGSMLPRQSIRYASIDEANLEAVRDAATHFGVTVARDEYPQARCVTLRLVAPYRLTHGKRNPVTAWVDSLGLLGKRSHEKFVPQEVFSLPKNQIALFLRHLWATDGSVWMRPTGSQGAAARIYYASTSRRLVNDVANLLWRFGIQTRVKTVRKTGYRDGYQLDIYGAGDQEAFCRAVGVHGKRGETAELLVRRLRDIKANTNVDTIPRAVWERVRDVLAERGMTHRQFAAAMGTQFCGSTLWRHSPSRERIARVAEILDDNELEMLATNDVTWDEVVSIEPDGVEPVYDATVAGAHNFIANGIAVHNSIEQDADVVILLHRDDYYDKESPRAGEADFIIAKHRNGPTDTVTVAAQLHLSRFVDMAIV